VGVDAEQNPGMTKERTMGLLDGKVAIITGAGGGLGRAAYAKLFAPRRRGCHRRKTISAALFLTAQVRINR
jgi:hypothetical protein